MESNIMDTSYPVLQPQTGPLAFLLFCVLFRDVYGMRAGGICIMPLVANEQLPTTVGKGQQPGRGHFCLNTYTNGGNPQK